MGFSMGSAFSQQASQISGSINAPQMPPPPPSAFTPYYIYANNVQQGPFDLPTLQTLVSSGVQTPQTHLCYQGMPSWAPASGQADLTSLFGTMPPPPPVMP